MKGSRNYMGDKELTAAHMAGQVTFDLDKRKAVYQAAFDRVNDKAYMMPLVPLPVVLAHKKGILVHKSQMHPEGFELNKVSWK